MGASVSMVGFVVWNLGHINTRPRSRSKARSTPGNGPLCGVLFKIYCGLQRAFYLLDLEPEVQIRRIPHHFLIQLRIFASRQ